MMQYRFLSTKNRDFFHDCNKLIVADQFLVSSNRSQRDQFLSTAEPKSSEF